MTDMTDTQTSYAADAPTAVFIPGLLSDGIVWEAAAATAAKRVPVATADVTSQTSITAMAQDTLEAHPGLLIAIGHSMGARVALEMARLAPRRVVGLILADTGIHPRKEGEEAKRQVVLDLARKEGMAALADAWLPPMVWEERHGDAALMSALRAMVLRADVAQHDRQIQALLDRPDAAATLADVACPVLLLVGRQDAWSPVAQHETMREVLPRADLVVIEDAGHFAPIEQPHAVSAAIADWLDRAL